MRSFIAGVITLCILGCKSPVSESKPAARTDTVRQVVEPRKKSLIDSTLYISKDSIIIESELGNAVYSKQEFNDIVTYFPALYSDPPSHPDVSYALSGVYVNYVDAAGNKKNISFGSEVGKDGYYELYAWFLRKKTGKKPGLATRRENLITIYNNINSLYSHFQYGGTYFAHQYARILGYAEYNLYWFARAGGTQKDDYSIEKQKALYIAAWRQLIEDEVSVDQNQLTKKDKEQHKKELFKIVDEIQKLITDQFYLSAAQEFQHTHY